MPCAEPDHHDAQPLEIAQERRPADEGVEVLRVPDGAGVHDDEGVVEPLLGRPVVRPRARLELLGVDPVGNHLDASGRGALVHEAELHRLADRHDAVGPAQVERDELAQGADDERVLQPLHALRDLGEDVLADDEERHAEAPRDDEPDVADDGWVGHAEHEVGPLSTERGEDRVAEVARVVGRAKVDLRAVVGRGADADDLDPVSRLARRQVVAVEMTGDNGDVVVER